MYMLLKKTTNDDLIVFDMNGQARKYILHIPE